MKKIIFFSVVMVLLSVGLMAQTTEKVQNRTQSHARTQVQEMKESDSQDNTKMRTRKQERINDRNEAASHGENVSTLAKETESGPGKGEIVSEAAKTQGEAQKMGEKTSAGNRSANRNTGARGSVLHRNNTRIQKGHVAGRK